MNAITSDSSVVEDVLKLGNLTRATASAADLDQAMQAAREMYLASAFIMGADRSRFGKLIEDLENNYTMSSNRWPTTMTNAYHLLVHWKQNPKNVFGAIDHSDGVAFVTDGSGGE